MMQKAQEMMVYDYFDELCLYCFHTNGHSDLITPFENDLREILSTSCFLCRSSVTLWYIWSRFGYICIPRLFHANLNSLIFLLLFLYIQAQATALMAKSKSSKLNENPKILDPSALAEPARGKHVSFAQTAAPLNSAKAKTFAPKGFAFDPNFSLLSSCAGSQLAGTAGTLAPAMALATCAPKTILATEPADKRNSNFFEDRSNSEDRDAESDTHDAEEDDEEEGADDDVEDDNAGSVEEDEGGSSADDAEALAALTPLEHLARRIEKGKPIAGKVKKPVITKNAEETEDEAQARRQRAIALYGQDVEAFHSGASMDVNNPNKMDSEEAIVSTGVAKYIPPYLRKQQVCVLVCVMLHIPLD
jgi:hypothetical protein